MAKKEVLGVFKTFARSQGFYGRLLNAIGWNGENAPEGFFDQFNGCKSPLDVILTVEC